jgi:hypothetical protein
MAQDDHKKCYGTMFPSTLPPEANRPVPGKVFSFEVVRAGGTFVSHRRVAADVAEWDDCLQCPEFDHCYKLCMGKFALEQAVAG